jgi:hypothetical protein
MVILDAHRKSKIGCGLHATHKERERGARLMQIDAGAEKACAPIRGG